MKKYLLFVAAILMTANLDAQIVINEIMQSNIDCIMDDLNDFPDSWVELYNSGTTSVQLSSYSLGTKDKADKAWQLPDHILAPQQYCIVYCDKEATGWHTDFRLESGKDCTLYLFNGSTIEDRLPSGMKKQPAPNIAYGRETDGSSKWGYQLTPTPGTANSGEICSNKDILGEPVFSVTGRVFQSGEKFTVKLSLPEGAPEGTEIRYTDDGSEPTEQSKRYGTSPLRIGSTRMIRAKLFCKGYLSPRSVTHTYICIDREVTLPVISVVTDSRYLYDDAIGIYVEGSGSVKNYENNWRRPINFEYFEDNLDKSTLNQLCEARITGGASRGCSLKSLGLYANKRFGEKRFSHEFFPDQRPGITDYKSIMLRNAGNDFDYLYMRDAIIQRLMSSHVDIDWQAWSPAIFYLNGEYKGILNIRERSNENNIYSNYNGLEDITMVENLYELKSGSWEQWQEFMDYYNEHGHTWADYDERMDVEEYLNIMIMDLFFNNLDFPGNNIVWWRPTAQGGRWRVVVKDTDFTLGLYGESPEYQIIKWLYNPDFDWNHHWGANSYEATRLFRRLMEDKTFYREFIDRFAIYMGDFLNFDRTWEVWEPMYEKIRREYPVHRALYNRWWPVYSEELEKAQSWLKNRVSIMYNELKEYYKLGNPSSMEINGELTDEELSGMEVSFNGVKLSRGRFDGMFFAGREVTLQAESASGWDIITVERNGSNSTKHVDGSTYTFTMPDCLYLGINAIKSSDDGIDDITADSNAEVLSIHNIAGIKQSAAGPGISIVRTKGGTKKVLKR